MEVDQCYIACLSSFGLTSIMVYVFSVHRPFISNKEKADVSFFLFPYSKCMEVDQMVHSAFIVFWPYKDNGICFLFSAVS